MPEFREMIKREGQDGVKLLFADLGQLKSLPLDPLPNVYEDGNGNIGIGTISPSTLLHLRAVIPTVYAQVAPSVADTVLVVANVQTTESTDDQAQILFNVNGGTQNRVASIGLIAENSANRLGALVFTTDDGASRTEKMRITGAGGVLVGETTPITSFNGPTIFQVSEATNGTMLVHREAANVLGPTVELLKRRSVWTVVQNGDQLGSIEFEGADGVDAAVGARLRATVDGTPGSNDLPTRLDFDTTPDGSGSPTTRMSIAPNGRVGIGVLVPDQIMHIADPGISSETIFKHENTTAAATGNIVNFSQFAQSNAPTDEQILEIRSNFSNIVAANLTSRTTFLARDNNSQVAPVILAGSNVMLGSGSTTAVPQNSLDVEGGAVIGVAYSGTQTSPSNGLLVEGNVGIGTAAPIDALSVQGISANPVRIDILAGDGDGTDFVSLVVNGVGTPTAQINIERLLIQYSPGDTLYRIRTNASGTGVVRALQIQTGSNNDQLFLATDGNIGIGTSAPQGQVHAYDTISGFLLWEFDGLDATVRTIIPNGTGDVLYRLHAAYVLRDSAAAVASNTTDVSNGASVNLTVGGNTVRLRVNADGSTDIARTAGADTIKVALTLRWL